MDAPFRGGRSCGISLPAGGVSGGVDAHLGDVSFEADRDYTVDRANGIVSRTRSSRIPFATLDELYPPDDPFVLIGEDDEFHRRQVAATYTHPAGAWQGYVPHAAASQLTRTRRPLESSQRLTVCITGDSISEGYNASAFTGASPSVFSFVANARSGALSATGNSGVSRVSSTVRAVAGNAISAAASPCAPR